MVLYTPTGTVKLLINRVLMPYKSAAGVEGICHYADGIYYNFYCKSDFQWFLANVIISFQFVTVRLYT